MLNIYFSILIPRWFPQFPKGLRRKMLLASVPGQESFCYGGIKETSILPPGLLETWRTLPTDPALRPPRENAQHAEAHGKCSLGSHWVREALLVASAHVRLQAAGFLGVCGSAKLSGPPSWCGKQWAGVRDRSTPASLTAGGGAPIRELRRVLRGRESGLGFPSPPAGGRTERVRRLRQAAPVLPGPHVPPSALGCELREGLWASRRAVRELRACRAGPVLLLSRLNLQFVYLL